MGCGGGQVGEFPLPLPSQSQGAAGDKASVEGPRSAGSSLFRRWIITRSQHKPGWDGRLSLFAKAGKGFFTLFPITLSYRLEMPMAASHCREVGFVWHAAPGSSGLGSPGHGWRSIPGMAGVPGGASLGWLGRERSHCPVPAAFRVWQGRGNVGCFFPFYNFPSWVDGAELGFLWGRLRVGGGRARGVSRCGACR